MNRQLYIPATMLAAFVGDSPYMSQEEAIQTVLNTYYYRVEVVKEEVQLEPELKKKATEIINSETVTKEQKQILESVDPEIKSDIIKARGIVKESTAFDKLREYFNRSKRYKNLVVTPNEDKHYHYVSDDCIIGGVVDGICYTSTGDFKGTVEIKNRINCFFKRETIYKRKTDLYQILTYYKAFTPYFDNLLPEREQPLISLVQVHNGKISVMEFSRDELDKLWLEVEPKIKRAMKIASNIVHERAILESTLF